MNAFLMILLLAVLGLAGCYFLLPLLCFRFVIGSLRRWGRLQLRTQRVDGDDWPYLAGGPESGEVVVLLHGFGADKDNWPAYARHLTRAYHVIAPDLPGFGDNFKDPERRYGASEQAERLHAFLAALGVRNRFHLAGNSMGGYIALAFALKYPESLFSLTLLDNAGVLSERKSDVQQALDRGENPFAMKTPDDLENLMRLAVYRPIPIPGAFKRVLFDRAAKDQTFIEPVQYSIMAEIDTGHMNRELANVSVPVLVIWGRQDRLVDISTVDVLTASIPNTETVIFEETGHMPMIERPAQTARAHADFMRRASAAKRLVHETGRSLDPAL